MEIIYNTHTKRALTKNVIYNQYFTPNETAKSPKYKISDLGYTHYVLIMYDPDAPSGNYWHWIIDIDISANSHNEILYYAPPTPPKYERHRYKIEVFGRNSPLSPTQWGERTLSLDEGKERLGLEMQNPILMEMFICGYPTKEGGKRNTRKTKRRKTKKRKTNRKNKY